MHRRSPPKYGRADANSPKLPGIIRSLKPFRSPGIPTTSPHMRAETAEAGRISARFTPGRTNSGTEADAPTTSYTNTGPWPSASSTRNFAHRVRGPRRRRTPLNSRRRGTGPRASRKSHRGGERRGSPLRLTGDPAKVSDWSPGKAATLGKVSCPPTNPAA